MIENIKLVCVKYIKVYKVIFIYLACITLIHISMVDCDSKFVVVGDGRFLFTT